MEGAGFAPAFEVGGFPGSLNLHLGLDSLGGETVFVVAGALLIAVAEWGTYRAFRVFWTPTSWARIRFDAAAGQIVHEVMAKGRLVEQTIYPFDERSRIEISVRKHYSRHEPMYKTYETSLKNPSTPRLELWPRPRSRDTANEFVDRIYRH